VIRAKLYMAHGRSSVPVTLITGTREDDDGPARLAHALGADMAATGTRVLLVYGDGSPPGLPAGGAGEEKGDLAAVFAGDRSLQDAATAPPIAARGAGSLQVHAVWSSPHGPQPEPERWAALLEEARDQWDAVVLAFCRSESSSALVVSQIADAWFLTLTVGVARTHATRAVAPALAGLSKEPAGVVLMERARRVRRAEKATSPATEGKPKEAADDEQAELLRSP